MITGIRGKVNDFLSAFGGDGEQKTEDPCLRHAGASKRILSGFLEAGEGGVFVTCEVEDAIKTSEGEDTFIVDGESTEDKTMLTGTEEVAQFYEIIDAYGGYHLDLGEVDYYVRVFFFGGQVDERVKLTD